MKFSCCFFVVVVVDVEFAWCVLDRCIILCFSSLNYTRALKLKFFCCFELWLFALLLFRCGLPRYLFAEKFFTSEPPPLLFSDDLSARDPF